MNIPLVGVKINVVKGVKKRVISKNFTVISRLCKAVVIKIDNSYKAKILISGDECEPEYIIIPFTEDSYNLKGKEIIFSKERTDKGYICNIRDIQTSIIYPGDSTKFIPFRENIVIVGNIVKQLGKMYFNYKGFMGFNSNVPPYKIYKLKEDTPIFKK